VTDFPAFPLAVQCPVWEAEKPLLDVHASKRSFAADAGAL
jgi:hypothetical protein